MAKVTGGLAARQTAVNEAAGKKTGLQSLIRSMQGEIAKALPSVITPERFTRMLFTAISRNPQLVECTPESFMGAMMQAAQLGVEPNTPLGQAYLIPYRNHGRLECQFQLGCKGLIDLAYRSGDVTDISAHEVHENDAFEYELGLTPKLTHRPAMKNRGPVIAYYAVFHTKNGGYGFQVMSKDDVEAFAKKASKSFNSGPWQTYFDEMAKKTVLKKALKYAPMRAEFAKAIAADGTIKSSISENMSDMADEKEYVTIDSEAKEAQPDPQAAPQQPTEEEEIPMDWGAPHGIDPETGEVFPRG